MKQRDKLRQKSTIKSVAQPLLKKNSINNETLLSLNKYFDKYGIYCLLLLVTSVTFIVFKDFIFHEKLYLFKDIGSDSINANYPHGFQVAYYMQHEGLIPKWSFYQGMGQNIFPLSIPDPYYFVLTLCGPNNLAQGIALMEIAKIFSAAIFFYLFLKKVNIKPFAAILGGVVYSYSSFIILGSCWNIFSTEAVYIALLLYAFEKFYQDNNIILFPIAVCLIGINQPFDLFIIGLFLLIYILFRFFYENDFDAKKLGVLVLKTAGLGLLGVSISSFFLFSNILQMLESPRVSGESSYFSKLMAAPVFGTEGELHNVTALLRLFSSDILGTGSDYKGWNNYLEAPLFYFGLVNLLLIPQVFQFLDKKRKIIFSIFIAAFLLPVIFPFFRYAFWLFTGNYYRVFSFFVVTSLLLCSMHALSYIDRNFKINYIVLIISIVVFLILLFRPYFPDEDVINEDIRTRACLFLIFYTILIAALPFRRVKNFSKLILLLVTVVELVNFSNITINDRPVIYTSEFKQKAGYNDYTKEAISYLKANDKSFFRVHKEYSSGVAVHTSINDAQVQKFYGTPSYYSFNQINYINFLQELAIINGKDETQTRWAPGLSGLPFLHPFASIKYALTKNPKSILFQVNYDSLTTVGDVEILKNKYALPLGFCYTKYISKKDFATLSNNQKVLTLVKAFIFDDSIYKNSLNLPRYQVADTSINYNWEEYANDITALKKDTLSIEKFTQNNIRGRINPASQTLLFFSIPFDKGWVAKIDNKEVKPLIANIGFTGLVIEKGQHEIELTFTPPLFSLGATISVISLILFFLLIFMKYVMEKKSLKEKNVTTA